MTDLITAIHCRRRQHQSWRRHFHHGQRRAVVRAFTAAHLYINGAILAAAEVCGSNTAYVQAAIILLRSDNAGVAAGRPRHCLPSCRGCAQGRVRPRLLGGSDFQRARDSEQLRSNSMPPPLVWKPRALDADAFTARKPNAVRGQSLVELPHNSFRIRDEVAARLKARKLAQDTVRELIMAEHEPSIGLSSDWLTPKSIFSGLELTFDLDPAHPGWENPHCVVPTRRIYTVDHDGLRQPWCGTLWLNPPFGGRRGQVPWLKRFFEHADGIALVAEEPKPRSLQRGVGDLAHSDVRLRGTP
jgi:hypothetical protein